MSDVIEKLAGSIHEAMRAGPIEAAESVLALFNLTPSAAASLAEGRGVVVPRNPTVQMYRAAFDELVPCGDAQACWRAMIAASQKESET